MKTYYLWDLADTLFPERWEAEQTGLADYDAYVASPGYDPKTVDPKVYELSYKIPYTTGMFDISIADGFEEVLSWTKNNGVFTTGIPVQMDWRAQRFVQKYNYDPRPLLPEIISTFDYVHTNKKNETMLVDIIRKKWAAGFQAIVYADDKLKNCQQFLRAAETVKKERPGLACRVYNILNDNRGIRERKGYWEAGSLRDIKENEQRFA